MDDWFNVPSTFADVCAFNSSSIRIDLFARDGNLMIQFNALIQITLNEVCSLAIPLTIPCTLEEVPSK